MDVKVVLIKICFLEGIWIFRPVCIRLLNIQLLNNCNSMWKFIFPSVRLLMQVKTNEFFVAFSTSQVENFLLHSQFFVAFSKRCCDRMDAFPDFSRLFHDEDVWCWSDRVWREPSRRLGGEASSCRLRRTAGRPTTAPGPGKAATACFEIKREFSWNESGAWRLLLTVPSCMPSTQQHNFMLNYCHHFIWLCKWFQWINSWEKKNWFTRLTTRRIWSSSHQQWIPSSRENQRLTMNSNSLPSRKKCPETNHEKLTQHFDYYSTIIWIIWNKKSIICYYSILIWVFESGNSKNFQTVIGWLLKNSIIWVFDNFLTASIDCLTIISII